MHGLVLREFQKYYIKKFGLFDWMKFTREEREIPSHFEITMNYNDNMFFYILQRAILRQQLDKKKMLVDFGKFMVPFLLKVYQPKEDWNLLDLLENTEEEIHHTVRMRNKEAHPPRLRVVRWGPEEVEIRYSSSRKLLFLGLGIIQGLIDHYKEDLKIQVRKLAPENYSIRVTHRSSVQK